MLNLLIAVLPRRGACQLLLAIALVGTGVAVASFSRGVAEANGPAATASSASEPAQAILPIVVLPTIVVHSEPEIPTLATVTVRSGEGRTNERPPIRARLLPVHAVTSFASTGSAGSGFGMPYYSFGKPLHHGTEE
jgi:multisubunit Na+/H+ antiporter MnhC subunit